MMATERESNNRRPLAVRRWSLFEKIAAHLAVIGVTPNAISVSSMVFGGAAGVCLLMTSRADPASPVHRGYWFAVAVLIQLRLIANLLDGMVAIEGGKKSAVGELYNEVPDRISDTAIFIGAGYAFGSAPWLGYLAAVVAMFVAYVRAIGASVGAGQQFVGPMAKQQRMALLTVTAIFHGLLPTNRFNAYSLQYSLIAVALALIILGGGVTSIVRLVRIARWMKQSGAD